MSTTQVPPTSPASSSSRQTQGGDLYDARYWESAYREIDAAPTLLLQLQDDLSRARRREAFWLSAAVHLVVVLLLLNSDKLGRLLPRGSAVIAQPISARDKDLTYLELPPDEQKLTKRPDTNIISDKDRIATSKTPQLDRQALKKILESSRPGSPSVPVPTPAPGQQPSLPAGGQPAPAQPQAPPAPTVDQNFEAKLQTPPRPTAKPSFNTGSGYAGDQIAQAARGAAASRGSYGDGGDFGQGGQGAAQGGLDVLSDTMGVDFGPYLQRVLFTVKRNWYALIPESARAPIMKKGKVGIEFAIQKDGTIAGMKLVSSSGDVALDRGAWGGITDSNPFPPLPKEFGGQYLALRFRFYYNPEKGDME